MGFSLPTTPPLQGFAISRWRGLIDVTACAGYVSNGMDAPTSDGINVPEWKWQQPLEPEGALTMQITTIGIDLAKNVFRIHGADQRGKAVLRRQLRRDQVAPFFANLPPCRIGTEACSSAHHWVRKLQALGHTVRLMAPQFV